MRIATIAILLSAALTAPASACAGANDIVAWLNANNIESLSKYLEGIQRGFENGALTEIELRDAYRPVYELDAVSVTNLRAWAAAAPHSHVAQLALGIYLKRLGRAARGDKYVAETPILGLVKADWHFLCGG